MKVAHIIFCAPPLTWRTVIGGAALPPIFAARFDFCQAIGTLWSSGRPPSSAVLGGLDVERGALMLAGGGEAVDSEAIRLMIRHLERRAAAYGLQRVILDAPHLAASVVAAAGYSGATGKSLARRITKRQKALLQLLRELGIAEHYGRQRFLPLQDEPRRLVTIGRDIHGREALLAPGAARAFAALRRAAAAAGIELQAVSAFRDVAYQAAIVRRKLAAGLSLAEILRVSAAPGYSEHHSGRALDLATSGDRPLEITFSETAAYRWLKTHAARFGFFESYPKVNPYGLVWEPWHWRWRARG